MLKKTILTLVIVLNCSLLFAPPRPPESSGGGTPGAGDAGGGGVLGGGAPIDGGLSIMLILGMVYAGKKTYVFTKNKIINKV